MKDKTKVEDAEVFRHPQETLDGEPLWFVEYYDKNGKTILTENFKSKTSAYMSAMLAIDAKFI
jgi:hypothetical protein